MPRHQSSILQNIISQIRENFLTPGCEPIHQDKGNFIYTGIILGLGTLAIIAGTFAGRGSVQGMQVRKTRLWFIPDMQ
jgi:hypothetical protein